MSKEKRNEEFKVNDKRRFSNEGDQKGSSKEGDTGSGEVEDSKPEKGSFEGEEAEAVRDIDFSTFLLSLATSAQVHLGLMPNPASGKQEVALPFAKQTIDILGILGDKTKGNLTDDEKKLLDHLLYDLRMVFLEKEKSKGEGNK